MLILRKNNTPKPCLANAITALSEAPEWKGTIWFDAFHLPTTPRGLALWPELPPHQWSTTHDIRTAEWLQRHGIFVSPFVAGQAVEAIAHKQKFHPVLDYLDRCPWDHVPRLDAWAIDYLGAEDTPYVRAVGARWMLSAIARVQNPGCKADCALVLEGKQGTIKSTALKTLAAPWFADELAEIGSKDAALQLAGKWIIELGELDNIARPDVSRIKSFMSRECDWYRPPYERRAIDQPRQCVFAGTVNHKEYLRDETGGRRFWPIVCSLINIEGLAASRDQLWAEARHRYFKGECWWLDTAELVGDAEEQQEARYQHDAWEPLVTEYISSRSSVSVGEILKHKLGIPVDKWNQIDQNRVARCLRLIKWERKQVRAAGSTQRMWLYFRPER
jgi:predicted P-loop ATPase